MSTENTNPEPANPLGAGGDYSLIGPTKAARLEARAILEDWGLSDNRLKAVAETQVAQAIDPQNPPRERTMAARAVFIAVGKAIDMAKPASQNNQQINIQSDGPLGIEFRNDFFNRAGRNKLAEDDAAGDGSADAAGPSAGDNRE